MNDLVDVAPKSMGDYLARYHANHRVEGFGLDVTTHCPCPFCGAPDFMIWTILAFESVASRGATCRQCGRSSRAIVTTSYGEGGGVIGKSIEIIQTGGRDQEAWFEPKIRRSA